MFAFLSLLQLGVMQFYLLHSGMCSLSIADYSVRFCGVSLGLAMSPQDWLGLFFSPKCPAESTCELLQHCGMEGQHVCTLTFMTHFHMHTPMLTTVTTYRRFRKEDILYLGLLVLLQSKKINIPEKFKTGPKNCYRVSNNYSAFTNTTKSN